jgi:hypothetical protein
MYHCVDTLIHRGFAMTNDERASFLLAEAGLSADPGTMSMASDYLSRTRRGRRFGIIGGLVLGACLPAAARQAMLALPLIPAGYLLGVLVSELLTPLPIRSPVRSAELRPRRRADLPPHWARATYWVLLIPVLAAPLLMLTHRAPGVTRIVTADYTCRVAVMTWPRGPLVLAAVLGASALAIAEITLAALTRRARPADDPRLASLDDVMRRMSARSIAAGATAVGLTMLAMICQELDQVGHAFICPARPAPLPAAYPWAASLAPWTGWAGLVLLAAALLVAVTFQWRNTIPRAGLA